MRALRERAREWAGKGKGVGAEVAKGGMQSTCRCVEMGLITCTIPISGQRRLLLFVACIHAYSSKPSTLNPQFSTLTQNPEP